MDDWHWFGNFAPSRVAHGCEADSDVPIGDETGELRFERVASATVVGPWPGGKKDLRVRKQAVMPLKVCVPVVVGTTFDTRMLVL